MEEDEGRHGAEEITQKGEEEEDQIVYHYRRKRPSHKWEVVFKTARHTVQVYACTDTHAAI